MKKEKVIIKQLVIEIKKCNLTLEQIPEFWRVKVEQALIESE